MSESRYSDKSQKVAIALALIGGLFGTHRFYLGEIGKGLIYLAVFWTIVPAIVSWYDAFKYFRNPDWFS